MSGADRRDGAVAVDVGRATVLGRVFLARAVAGALAATLLAGCASGCTTAPAAPSSSADAALTAAQTATRLEELTNDARAAEGLPALDHSDCAAAAAADRATDLMGDPDLTHAAMGTVLADCAVSTAGENLSRATRPPDEVMDAWLASPGHRSNILDPAYSAIGVACVADGEATLCSQVFLGE